MTIGSLRYKRTQQYFLSISFSHKSLQWDRLFLFQHLKYVQI